ncbi:hypothetical protein HK096_007937 [Nowakowskiella sp. JEL0078]|nr:hypothetical protein HK096_007937 [Nowakowskiella sp. JEL0078]
MVGGLLSAHLIAVSHDSKSPVSIYDGHLLTTAEEITKLLLPAFDTPTGLPYGSINLLTGVAIDESTLVCTACAGTFALEFTWLSLLTGNPIYEATARRAMRALWEHRSTRDMWGSHIDVNTGEWIYLDSSIGGGVDSFFEYLLKAFVGFSDEVEYGEMFLRAYRAVKIYMRKPPWHVDVLMDSGRVAFPYFRSLGAFWPGLKILAGDVAEAIEELKAINGILRRVQFLPEAINLSSGEYVSGRMGYPLRPELIESSWYAYQATKDFGFVEFGMDMVDRTRTNCGFANIEDVLTLNLEDKFHHNLMPAVPWNDSIVNTQYVGDENDDDSVFIKEAQEPVL